MRESTGSNRLWVWIYGGTGAIMTIAVCVFVWVSIQSREQNTTGTASGPIRHPTHEIPAERYQLMARFDPPAYQGNQSQLFERYAAHDYAGAASSLRGVNSPEAHFYRGISLLAINNVADGTAELRSVIAIGDSPYLEQSHFYLGKGLLAHGEIPEARAELKRVVDLHGVLEKQAKALLASMEIG